MTKKGYDIEAKCLKIENEWKFEKKMKILKWSK